ncbi:MFS transporter [Brachybacterium halotolerans subsp. kimchii]|uniref:MFS transporter n=1 Tax=Brachybacterium halotolerans TaxID=2795215 RepID=UPI001E4862D1|nr:MFS transporter [Brachybacterium halotolerans]UEJ81584.1 MFS transporter [Brachybacterium halotolerans subsp. kimchii]
MNTRTTTPPARRRLPLGFHLWWCVATLVSGADAMLGFALIWVATGLGPTAVALVSTLAVVPRIALLLVGGAVGDQVGPRRMLVIATMAQVVVLLTLIPVHRLASALVFLALASGMLAIVSAFQQPAAVVLPRLLIDGPDQLPRALARISGSTQAARIIGVASGGIAVQAWALENLILTSAVAATSSLGALLILASRIRSAPESHGLTVKGGVSVPRAILDGIRSAHHLRIWPLLGAVALLCAAVLPTIGVVLPSAARLAEWSSSRTGLLESAWAAGSLGVTFLISFTGTSRHMTWALTSGLVVVGVALAVLALRFTPGTGTGACLVLGIGTALATTHIAPALLSLAPPDQMTRYQSLMTIVQLAPPLLLNAPFSALAGTGHAKLALIVAGVASVLGAALILHEARSRRQHALSSDADAPSAFG